MMSVLKDRRFLFFVVKFLLLFAILYYGTIMIIGLAAPGGWYISFVDKHLDYVSWIKKSLLSGVQFVFNMINIKTVIEPGNIIRIINKRGVRIAMDCVGYGVYSFWIAYILANKNYWLKKIVWITGGVLLLWLINVGRISLFLYVINNNQSMPLGIDHHTWFTILAYTCIFIMLVFYNQLNKKPS